MLTTPAIQLLKRGRPDLEIAVVVERRFAGVFEGNPDVQTLLSPSLRDINQYRPSLVLNLHGGTRSMLLTLASGARVRAGFAHHRGSRIYNVRIPTAQHILRVNRKVHTAEHLASAMFYLGAERQPIPRANLFALSGPEVATPYAILHPVAASAEKTWPAERFLSVARHVSEQHGLQPIFIGSGADDMSRFSLFRTVSGAPLSEIKPLLAGATLFIGNDSGPAHMAAAFGVPVIVLFGPSDPEIWGPWRTDGEVLKAEDGKIGSLRVHDVHQAVDDQLAACCDVFALKRAAQNCITEPRP